MHARGDGTRRLTTAARRSSAARTRAAAATRSAAYDATCRRGRTSAYQYSPAQQPR
jgi:hypothetical protein